MDEREARIRRYVQQAERKPGRPPTQAMDRAAGWLTLNADENVRHLLGLLDAARQQSEAERAVVEAARALDQATTLCDYGRVGDSCVPHSRLNALHKALAAVDALEAGE